MEHNKLFLAIIGSILEITIGIITFYLIRLVFDVEIVGYYGVIVSFLLTFSFIIDLSISTIYLKFYSGASTIEKKSMYNGAYLSFRLFQLFIYIIIILIVFSLFPLHGIDIYVFILFFIGIIFELSGWYILSFILLAQNDVVKKSFAVIISSSVRVILILIAAYNYPSDILSLAYIYLISDALYFLINLYFLRDIKIKSPNFENIKKFLKLSPPLIIMSCFIILTSNIDVLLINSWFYIEDVANFFTAKQLFSYFILVINNFLLILISFFSWIIKEGDFTKSKEYINKIHKLLNLIIVPLAFISLIYLSPILTYIIGDDYRLTGIILSILLFKFLTNSVDIANEAYLYAKGQVSFISIKYIIECVLTIILFIIFISPFFLNLGVIGGAIAIILTNFIVFSIYRILIYKKYNLGFNFGFFRNIIIMIFIVAIQFFINSIFQYSIFMIPLFILIDLILYFSINYLLKGFSKSDIFFAVSLLKISNIKKSILSEFKKIE